MIFSKKLRKTAASVLALVMVFAMSTGAFAYTGTATADGDYYNVSVSYAIEGTLPTDAQISIIALAGAQDADATVTFEGNTATNVLWIDQQAAASSGTFTFQVAKADAGEGFNIKSGVTGGNTMTGYVEIAAVEPPSQEQSNDATLASLTVGGENVNLDHAAGTGSITLGANAASVEVVATKNHSEATVAGDGTINLIEGANTVAITVTAEDGTQKVYTITITNPAAGGTDPVDPPAGGEAIANDKITIGGNAVTDANQTITSSEPFGMDNAHVVRVDTGLTTPGSVPTKVVAHNGSKDGVETFYTEYKIGDETKIKLVTVITDESLTAGDLTLVDGTPQKLVYGDIVGGDGEVKLADVMDLLSKLASLWSGDNIKDKLISDVDGSGDFKLADVMQALSILSSLGSVIPGAAQ